MTKCLYSRNGIPWLRFNSLVRSVMSVCSSAKPYTKRPADGKSCYTPPAETVSRLARQYVARLISASSSLSLEWAEAGLLEEQPIASGSNHQHPTVLMEGMGPLPPGEQPPAGSAGGGPQPAQQSHGPRGQQMQMLALPSPIALAGVCRDFCCTRR